MTYLLPVCLKGKCERFFTYVMFVEQLDKYCLKPGGAELSSEMEKMARGKGWYTEFHKMAPIHSGGDCHQWLNMENIAKVEPAPVKVWDMQVRASARILEKGTQDDLITRTAETRNTEGGRDWKDHSTAWIPVKKPHYNTCLEEILSSIGENGERKISWDFNRKTRAPQALTKIEELGTKDTDKVVWELRIQKELEEEGWTVCYSDGSGLDDKAAGAYTRKCFSGLHEKKTGSNYLGTRATHYGCHCQDDAQPEQSGEHLVERCRLLAEKRKLVEKGELREWRTRHSRNQLSNKKEKGPVEPEKEEEEDKLESFFCHLYEFHNPVLVAPAFVPAELPPRYAINFTPAVPSVPVSVIGSPANLIHDAQAANVISTPSVFNTAHVISTPSPSVSVSATPAVAVPVTDDFSVVSSANFIPASVFTSSSCIGTTQ